jgi:hypothetical protein
MLLVLCSVYACLLPYAVEASALVCTVRLHAVPVAYAALFSVLFSRSLMLATADFDGLPGHVSGLTQSFLFLLLAGLQENDLPFFLNTNIVNESNLYYLKNRG